MRTDETHLMHKLERDTVRENLRLRPGAFDAGLQVMLERALDALDRKDALIAKLEEGIRECDNDGGCRALKLFQVKL